MCFGVFLTLHDVKHLFLRTTYLGWKSELFFFEKFIDNCQKGLEITLKIYFAGN